MADRALTESDRNMLRLLAIAHVGDPLSVSLNRVLAEHAALREVARAAERWHEDRGRSMCAALAALEAAHPGLLEKEG